jgi:hypothetical protein
MNRQASAQVVDSSDLVGSNQGNLPGRAVGTLARGDQVKTTGIFRYRGAFRRTTS